MEVVGTLPTYCSMIAAEYDYLMHRALPEYRSKAFWAILVFPITLVKGQGLNTSLAENVTTCAFSPRLKLPSKI